MIRTKIAVAALACAAVGLGTSAASASPDLCVGGRPGCFTSVQAALAAAGDGDTITVAPGTYAGPITIDKSITLLGSGAASTIIRGGGPVITIGQPAGLGAPNVSIAGVTITGGLNTTQPFPGNPFGGGVWIAEADATVTISDSIVTGNRATSPPALTCDRGPCAPRGGGIDNAGTLTVTDTRITDNVVGSADAMPSSATNVRAGGVFNRGGATLTLRNSLVTGNRAAATTPEANFAVAGGISDFGTMTIDDSVVSDNTVDVEAAFPAEIQSFTGGIEVTGNASAAIAHTIVRDNSVRGANASADVIAGAGGISTDPDVTFTLEDSAVDRNSVTVNVLASGAGATGFAGGLDLEGHSQVRRTQFIGNDVRTSTTSGPTISIGGALETRGLETLTLDDSLVAGNSVEAVTTDGFVAAAGGGIFNGGLLTLRRTRVAANRVTATGPAGVAEGGGIWNDIIGGPPDFPQDVQLDLIDSSVVGNRLDAGPGIDPLGAGVFASAPVSLKNSVIAGNSPDQCSGSGCPQISGGSR